MLHQPVLILTIWSEKIETADEKRIRIAKEILTKAKAAKKEREEKDEFFATEVVQRDEEEDGINAMLQLDIVILSEIF